MEKLANHWNNNDENSEALNAFADAYLYKHEKKSQKVWAINRGKFSKQSLHGRILPQKPKLILIMIAPRNQRPMTSRKENGLNR
ncbi:hypothetical protein [Helicobacter pylori]|uniref:hypothetical protein n=1 Tax=Helicobacter pylori TaxID=210 RepID=UPI0034658B3E